MKTKELIRRLQKEDPSGELEVSVGNEDIHFVHRAEGYWDGCQQILVRNEEKKYYNIIGGRYNSSKTKVVIRTLSFHDAISNNPSFTVDYSDLSEQKAVSYEQSNEDHRKTVQKIRYEIELEHFVKHCKKRAGEISSDVNGLEDVCKIFFDKNISPDDPLPQDVPVIGYSYVDRRDIQWQREVDISFSDDKWTITKHTPPTVS